MIITINGIGIKIGEQLHQKIEQKLAKFHRFFGDEATCNVKLTPQKDDVRLEVTLKIENHYYRAEACAPEAIQALEQAIDIMEGQIRKHKTRIKKQKQEFSYLKEYLRAQAADVPELDTGSDEPTIIRRKSFDLTPMSADEAVLQMEFLGHAFLIYLDADTDQVNVVYKRNDGNYGLLEPRY